MVDDSDSELDDPLVLWLLPMAVGGLSTHSQLRYENVTASIINEKKNLCVALTSILGPFFLGSSVDWCC